MPSFFKKLKKEISNLSIDDICKHCGKELKYHVVLSRKCPTQENCISLSKVHADRPVYKSIIITDNKKSKWLADGVLFYMEKYISTFDNKNIDEAFKLLQELKKEGVSDEQK